MTTRAGDKGYDDIQPPVESVCRTEAACSDGGMGSTARGYGPVHTITARFVEFRRDSEGKLYGTSYLRCMSDAFNEYSSHLHFARMTVQQAYDYLHGFSTTPSGTKGEEFFSRIPDLSAAFREKSGYDTAQHYSTHPAFLRIRLSTAAGVEQYLREKTDKSKLKLKP